jgi:hypothetical protein
MTTRLVIYYDPPQASSPLPLAVVDDPYAIRVAAEAAIQKADACAKGLTEFDSELGIEARCKAEKLRSLLCLLIPSIRPAAAVI